MTTADAINEMQREVEGLQAQLKGALTNRNTPDNARRPLLHAVSHLDNTVKNLMWAKKYMSDYTDKMAEERYAK